MARRIPETRFQELIACAARVFIERGYRQTQMEDIAAALGVAKGTLYLYVESKEALFDAVLRYAGAPLETPPQLPLSTPKAGATLAYMRDAIERRAVLRALTQSALGRTRDDERAELEDIVRELYRTLSKERVRIRLIDKSAQEFPDMAALWFERVRQQTVTLLERYLEGKMHNGTLRAPHNAAATARLVLETVFHWAVDRHWDPHPTQTIDETVAERVLVEFVVAALAPQRMVRPRKLVRKQNGNEGDRRENR